jgi:SHS2 domain-containing protein
MYRWVEHTGELELEIEAQTEAGVFEQGFAAMRELLGGDDEPETGTQITRRVALEGSDRAVLLADWLAELAYLAETDGFVPMRVSALELAGTRLEAVVRGSEGQPPHLVKAATYHRLTFEHAGDAWRATVVLDV